jgi:hypothetical protein
VATLTTPSFVSTIGVGGATPSASGAGITFPATASASTDPNTLDDYEEGTWTPTDASGAGLTISVILGARYIKLGRLVFVNAYFDFPTTANGNQARIGGLPFTAAGNDNYSYLILRSGYSGKGQVLFQVNSGANSAPAYGNGGGTDVYNNNLSGQYILLSGCYYADS